MSYYWYTPNGDEVSTLRARITATGVALLMTYVVTILLISGQLDNPRPRCICVAEECNKGGKEPKFNQSSVNNKSAVFVCCVQ